MSLSRKTKFRSTGSYEPDLTSNTAIVDGTSFDPQALTSLTDKKDTESLDRKSFDPQALTSLTLIDSA